MTAYLFAEVTVKDRGAFEAILPELDANIREAGGKRIGGGFDKAVGFEGAPPPNRVALVEFPDMDALKALQAKLHAVRAERGDAGGDGYRLIGIEGI